MSALILSLEAVAQPGRYAHVSTPETYFQIDQTEDGRFTLTNSLGRLICQPVTDIRDVRHEGQPPVTWGSVAEVVAYIRAWFIEQLKWGMQPHEITWGAFITREMMDEAKPIPGLDFWPTPIPGRTRFARQGEDDE